MKNVSLKNSGIYKITCITTNKVYIGSSSNLSRRKKEHFGLLNKGTHGNVYLQSAWNKYGEGLFTFLNIETGIERAKLQERERYWIDYYHSLESSFGYNLSYPCDGLGVISHSESTKELLRRKAFEQFHKDSNLTYEEWLIQRDTSKKPYNIYEGKHILTISVETGEVVNKYISLAECGKSFSVDYKVIQKVLDLPTRSFRGLRIVSEDLYSKDIDYTKKKRVRRTKKQIQASYI